MKNEEFQSKISFFNQLNTSNNNPNVRNSVTFGGDKNSFEELRRLAEVNLQKVKLDVEINSSVNPVRAKFQVNNNDALPSVKDIEEQVKKLTAELDGLVVPVTTVKPKSVNNDASLVNLKPRRNALRKQRSKKYKLINNLKRTYSRSDQFLEPHFQFIDRESPDIDAPLITQDCRNPFHLPNPPSRSLSRESLVSSNGGSDAGSEDSGDTGYGAACDISLVERLRHSAAIWFLPGIQRAGAFHLLQGKEEGCFVVRQSSQSQTMALSVRLPPDKGPYIEHYLIQSADGMLGLETSENRFDSIHTLIAHYANCCDELPVQLVLPKAIRDARSRQHLSSLSLLGQEFWRYSPPPSTAGSPDADVVLNLNSLSTFKTAEPATPINTDLKPARPNTLNLINKIEPSKMYKNESKQPPPPPPRWSKPTTPQNNITVTTTFTFSVNSNNSPKSETPPPTQVELVCDPKRMSPDGQTSTLSSKAGSLRRLPEQILSPSGSILSPNSDPSSSSVLSPDTLSPLSITKTARHSRRKKVSKHYQESDILDSPTVYNRSNVGDKISDYEDVWTNDTNSSFKPKLINNNFASPDLLQHVVTNNNNNIILSPELSNVQSPKQGSPFYAEPADSLQQQQLQQLQQQAVSRRIFKRNPVSIQQRHSNPVPLLSPGLERLDAVELNEISSSVDNLSPKQRIMKQAKPVMPPTLKTRLNNTWQIDDGWKFMGNDCDVNMDSSDADYDSDWAPTMPNLPLSPFSSIDCDNQLSTVQEMISKKFPDLRQSDFSTTDEELCRMSAYDNVDDKRIPRPPPSEISELTEFSDPWNELSPEITTETDDSFMDNPRPPQKLTSVNRTKSFTDKLNPLVCTDRLSALRNKDTDAKTTVGTSIRNYALGLALQKSTTFAQNIDNFIACTCESKETNPQVVMRNMRQFMSGMKNYLVKHGEKGFDKEVEKERNKLKSTEFLNLDAILESVLHRLVVRPLRKHLEKLFMDHYTKTGAIKLLAENIQYANTRPTSELAIKSKVTLPNEAALKTIEGYLLRLQNADSPLEKLEYLLAAIATIFNSVKTNQMTGSGRPVTLGADDFLPLFVWVMVKTKFVAAEIEAEYMWGLLHPSLLSGEGGYYLTTLSSAVHVLKNFKTSSDEQLSSSSKTDCVLKVVVPDELHGSILTKTLPARPHMTTKEVCKIIAHKARITNPQDYALYRLENGEETMLADSECPQDFMNEGVHVMLAYKRIDAKIAWPRQQSN